MDRATTKAAAGLPTVTTAYNLAGDITGVSNPAAGGYAAHSTIYDYDRAGRRSYEQNDSRTVGYQYDPASNRTRLTWPDGYYVTYSYDAANRMDLVKQNGSTLLADYSYDSLSRRTGVQYAGSTANTVAYSYDPDSTLTELMHKLSSVTLALDYGYNKSRQITGLSASDSFYLGTPPAAATYTPNPLNQYNTVGGNNLGYDKNGNLLTWTSPNLGAQTYTYDSENQLRTAAVNGSGTATIGYDYDPLGRRISKTVGGTTTIYLLDGAEEIAELNSSGTVLRRFVTGPGIDDRIVDVEGSSTAPSTTALNFFHTNHQGSVIAITSNSGVIAQKMAYDPYGNLAAGSGAIQAYGYTGRRYDAETGLYYYRARYYGPAIGRFLQADPIESKDDLNLYVYVKNDPLNGTDSSGKCFEDLCIAEISIGVYLAPIAIELASKLIQKNEDHPTDKTSESPGESQLGARPLDQPVDLEEDLAGQEAKGIMEAGGGRPLNEGMNDPRIKSGEIEKIGVSHAHGDGTVTEVHGERDTKTKEIKNLKFKDDTNKKSRARSRERKRDREYQK